MAVSAGFPGQGQRVDRQGVVDAGSNPVAVDAFFGSSPQTISPSAIATAEAFGSAKVNLKLQPTGVTSQEGVSTPQVNQIVHPSSVSPSETFGTVSLTGGSTTIAPGAIATAEAFGTAVVSTLQIISPVGIGSGESFGTPASYHLIVASGIASGESFGTSLITLFIRPVGVSDGAIGSPRINQVVHPTGIPTGESFGIAKLSGLISGITGIVSAESFGTPAILTGLIRPTGIVSGEAVGIASVTAQLILQGGVSWPKTQHWTLYLAYSTQINPYTPERPPTIAELVYARDINIEIVLNRPGACHFSMQLDDDRAQLVTPLHTCILAVRDGIVRWSGPVWTVDHDLSGGRISVGAVGWLDLLDKRQVRTPYARPVEDEDVRVEAIFNDLNAQVDTNNVLLPPAIWYGGHEGNLRYPPLPAVSFIRGNPIGSVINGLVEIENGFDIHVDPVTRIMKSYRKPIYAGVNGYGYDRPNTLFSYGVGADNLMGLTQQIDGSTTANIINAVGPSGTQPQSTDDPDSIAELGAFEADFSMTDAGVSEELLQAAAVEEVFFRSRPRVTWQVTPFPWSPDSSVPRIFDDYDIGDVVRLAGRRAWLDIPQDLDSGGQQPVRVFGASISIDENGNERVSTLQLAPS